MRTLTVAVVSSQSHFGDVEANLAHFDRLIARAVGRGARLVCFPELALAGYSFHPRILDAAQPIPGPATEALAAIAKSRNVYLSVGMPERCRGRFYIAQTVVGPRGLLGKYRKRHLAGGEVNIFLPGKTFPTFDVDGFRLGVNICYDGRHPDTLEAMVKAGVDIIHHPHGNPVGLGRDAEEWTRGKMVYFVPRATRARAYILIHNSAGDMPDPDGTTQFSSGALVLDPLGQVVKRTTQHTRTEKTIVATLRGTFADLMPPFEKMWL